MPGRPQPLVNSYIYHVFNKAIEGKRIFSEVNICQIFLDVVRYYRSTESYLRYSKYRKLPAGSKQIFRDKISNKDSFRISLLAFSLMLTHYHFILRQNKSMGISFFMSQIQNSITRYYNLKNDRKGSIFLQTFKSKLIQSEGQLKHTSRYVHLNILSGGVVKNIEEMEKYPYSSFSEYISSSIDPLSESDHVLSLFENNRERYKKFVFDNAEHQKMLEYCKYSEKW